MVGIVSERQDIDILFGSSRKSYLSMLPNISEMEVSEPFSIFTILDMINAKDLERNFRVASQLKEVLATVNERNKHTPRENQPFVFLTKQNDTSFDWLWRISRKKPVRLNLKKRKYKLEIYYTKRKLK